MRSSLPLVSLMPPLVHGADELGNLHYVHGKQQDQWHCLEAVLCPAICGTNSGRGMVAMSRLDGDEDGDDDDDDDGGGCYDAGDNDDDDDDGDDDETTMRMMMMMEGQEQVENGRGGRKKNLH